MLYNATAAVKGHHFKPQISREWATSRDAQPSGMMRLQHKMLALELRVVKGADGVAGAGAVLDTAGVIHPMACSKGQSSRLGCGVSVHCTKG